ncbi:tyrosine-type recombinase/integrase (plasmid) [Neobacillus niacini]|jgi:integrase|uniref:tyrosine-type recombinase/integrase n=1 Tax=Neobacillus niacini TaxID=86668 RepID=UPI003B022413
MALTSEELSLLESSVQHAAERRKEIRNHKKEKHKPTDKQRKIEHLSKEQKKELRELQLQMGSMIQKNTHITASKNKDENTLTKQDMKKGNNMNQGVDGIHSVGYRSDILKVSNQFIKFCYEVHGIKELKHIKPRMAEEFCREKMENKEWTARTLGTRVGHLKKIGESASKSGIKHFSRLVTQNTENLKQEYKASKASRTRGKKANGDGLSLREARVIAKHAGDLYGPMGRVMVDVLTEAGPRAQELMTLKWEHFDFANNTMSMTQKNMNKNGRPRIIEDLSPKTLQKLQDIYESGLFKNPKQTIFRSHFHSEKGVRKVIEEAAHSGRVANLAIHAFRNATKEYQTKNFKKELKKMQTQYGKRDGTKRFKEMMAEKMLRYVGIDNKLNPVINKATGERKYTYEKLMNRRSDRVINDTVSQIFGHNRRNVLSEY